MEHRWHLLLTLLVVLGISGARAADLASIRGQIQSISTQEPVTDDRLVDLWKSVTMLSPGELDQLLRTGRNTYFEQGWFELAEAYSVVRGDVTARSARIEQWHRNWYHHPASALVSRLIATEPLEGWPSAPKRVAAVLPFFGEYAEPSDALVEGLESAYRDVEATGQPVPEIALYDSREMENPEAFLRWLAQSENVDLVVGPLAPASVEAMVTLDHLPVPVIALNRFTAPGFPGAALDLASDQELGQLAARVLDVAQGPVLLLIQNDDWARSLGQRFEQVLSWQGGEVENSYMVETTQILESVLASALGVTESRVRADRVTAIVEREVAFEPRPRPEISAVVMLTGPDLARRIKPMLDYLYAGDMPVFASSHVLGGHLDPQRDRDLEGVSLCDLPAVLNGQMENPFNALGYDAGLLSLSGAELNGGRLSLDGRTGKLRLGVGGRVIRTLACVRFKEGKPVPLPVTH